MKRLLKAFAADSRGATAIEYVIIASMVSIMIVVGATGIGQSLKTKFNAMASNLS